MRLPMVQVMRTGVAYVRTKRGELPDAQLKSIRSWAQRESVRIASWHIEQDVGNRALLHAMQSVKMRDAVLLVGARYDADAERVTSEAGVQLVTVTPALGPLARRVQVCTKAALQVKRDRGEQLGGHAPYGWRGETDGDRRNKIGRPILKLVPDAAEQLVIQFAKAQRETGASFRKIATMLTDVGYVSRAGTPFTHVQVAKMLERNVETGQR